MPPNDDPSCYGAVPVRTVLIAAPERRVTYYEPFTHYLTADVVRVFILSGALGASVMVLLIAHRRWTEQRRSAALFLIAIVMCTYLFAGAALIGLGRPPIWWYLAGELLVLLVVYTACFVVIGEAKRGIWARRE